MQLQCLFKLFIFVVSKKNKNMETIERTITTREELNEFLLSLIIEGKHIAVYEGKLTGCRCGCRGDWAHFNERKWERNLLKWIIEDMEKQLPLRFVGKKTSWCIIWEAQGEVTGFAINQDLFI